MSKHDKDSVQEPDVIQPEVMEDEQAADTKAAAEKTADTKPAKPKKLSKKEQIIELEQQVGEWQDKYLRLRADYDNYRKRMQREVEDARRFSKIGTLEEILPVLDHFQMAMTYANQSADFTTLKQGMDMILTEFQRSFENMGVVQVKTVGETFDPNLHEALTTEASDEVEEGTILREAKAGYRIGDRLLRAPAVIVSSGPAEPAGEDTVTNANEA